MHVKSLVLGAAVAFQASTAVAEAPRPRIYFPRHVKRQFTNTTTTSPDAFPPAEGTPFETRSESRNFVTSFRATVSDLLSTDRESSPPTSSEDQSSSGDATTIIVSTTSRVPLPEPTSPVTTSFFAPVRSSTRSTTDAETADETTQESSSDETTVTERNSSTGGLPTNILQPTDTEEDPTTTPEPSTAAATTTSAAPEPEETTTTSSSPVIIIGPTGVVSSSSSTPTTSSSSIRSSTVQLETSTAESVNTTVAADDTTTTTTRVPTTSDAAPTTESSSTPEAADTTSSAATTSDAATTSEAAATTSEAAVVTTSSANTTSEAVTTADAATTADPARSTEAATTSTSRLLDPIVSVISDIVPSVPANDTETTSTQLADPTTTLVEASTTSDSTDATSLPDITSRPTVLEPSITPNSTQSEVVPGETSSPPVDSSAPSSVPPTVTSISSFPPEESQVPSKSTTDLPPVSATASASETALPSVLPSESGSAIGNETSLASEPTATPTDLPVSSGLPSDVSDVSELSSSTAPPAVATTTAQVPSTGLTTADAATSTPPPDTWLPETIIAEQSTPTAVPTFPGASGSTAVALPSDLPQAIEPDTSDLAQPEGTRLLQVGFLYAENYQFVTEEPMAAAQIFTYLPQALAHGAQIDVSKIKVVRLVPFDTRASLGYITTLARFYYPVSMVDKLRMDIRYPNSLLYNHNDELVYNLTSNINSAIDIIPGNEIESNASGGDGGSSDVNNGNTNILGNSESESTPVQKGTAAAIGIGAVSVAAAYGAAMFLVARRYKQKKQAHRRSSSIANSSEMRYGGNGSPAMMGGALLSRDFTGYGYGGMAGGRNSHGSGRSGAGNSVRTAQISAPVAAENSLGWN